MNDELSVTEKLHLLFVCGYNFPHLRTLENDMVFDILIFGIHAFLTLIFRLKRTNNS